MTKKSVSMSQIAELANVSAMTVSRVLNNSPSVLPETRELPNYIAIVPHAGLKDGHAYSSVGKYDSESRAEQYMKNAPYRIKEIFEQADKMHPEKSFSDLELAPTYLRLSQAERERNERLQRDTGI